MGRFVGYEECPECVKRGRDRARDNLGRYSDGSAHCYSCGYHIFPKQLVRKETNDGSANKSTLPRDFTREIPAAAWKWLLQYGLSYQYWKPFTGYSPAENRLVFTVGEGPKFSIGRYLGPEHQGRIGDQEVVRGEQGELRLGMGGAAANFQTSVSKDVQRRKEPRKWFFWGDGHGWIEIVGGHLDGPIVLVEDIISQHKVGQVTPAICLFGTNVHDLAIRAARHLGGPVVLWLDQDQYTLLPKKINRLQTFLTHPVRFVSTEKDPKEYSLDEIRNHLS